MAPGVDHAIGVTLPGSAFDRDEGAPPAFMAERLDNASRVAGSELAEGLELDLEEIWAV